MVRIPRSTYRLQMGADFTFAEAQRVLPYLDELGVSDLYLSPIWKARRDSTHNYDVIDPNEIDPKIGSRSDLMILSEEARSRGMGIICDIVPNHMAASWENPWWWDVLLHGRASPFADVFDIDWDRGDGKVTLPVLGDDLDRVLDDLRIEGDQLRYHEHRFPLAGDRTADMRSMLEEQHYRLAYWRGAAVNYRRFFDIDDLVAVRADDPRTFALTHALVLDLLHERTITGVRIDHIDGLRDPAAYLRRLDASSPDGTYVVVEKILARDEHLRDDWICSGTTGYDFAAVCEGAFVDTSGAGQLRRTAETRTKARLRFETVARRAKREVVETHFASEVEALAAHLAALTPVRPAAIRRALVQATVALRVYRTYVTASAMAPADRDHVDVAVAAVTNADVREVLRAVFAAEGASGIPRAARLELVTRWEHLCAPAAAKGVEDTALYRHPVLISRNEVGGDPAHPATSPDELHAFLAARRRSTMNASSTHDSKRGEDVRARIDVLSEIPDEWSAAVRRWMRMNARARTRGCPDATDELYLYQTLIGTWPVHRSQRPGYGRRIRDHMLKAAREAKRRTSWLEPDERYEGALDAFVRHVLSDAAFGKEVGTFARTIAVHGAINSLARLVVKVVAPGVPDFYQGADLWHLRLVDPDNRAPVDLDLRGRALAGMTDVFARDPERLLRDLNRRWSDGRLKLFTTWRALRTRREHADVIADGEYIPLRATGAKRGNVVAFARRLGPRWVVACVPRLSTEVVRDGFPLADDWGTTRLVLPSDAPATLANAFTQQTVSTARSPRVADVLRSFPVALLTGEFDHAGRRTVVRRPSKGGGS